MGKPRELSKAELEKSLKDGYKFFRVATTKAPEGTAKVLIDGVEYFLAQ